MLWIIDQKTGIKYPDTTSAADALGVSIAYVSGLAHGTQKSQNIDLAIYDDITGTIQKEGSKHIPKVFTADYKTNTRACLTKCGECDNYSCSWIRNLKPVPGWDAVEVPQNRSHMVRECPEFTPMRERKEVL